MRKVASKDFTKDKLPSTRKEVFFDLIKVRYKSILLIGLILLCSLLPLLIVLFFRDSSFLGASLKVQNNEMSIEEYTKYWKSTNLIFGLYSVPCIFVACFGISFILRIVRQLVWQEPIFYKEDVIKSFKENIKTVLISSLFVIFVLVITKLSILIFTNAFVHYLPLGIFLFFFVPPLLLTVSMNAIYNGTFKQFFKNSVLIFIKNVPLMILFTIGVIFPIIFVLIDMNIIVRYVVLIVSIIFIVPLGIIAFELYSNTLFDKYINTTNYPEMVNKGLNK